MKALSIHAGPKALAMLRDRGLRAEDVGMVPGAAGGPKGLVLNPLDRFIFGEWLAASTHTVHLLGASIGAWRMATACLPDPGAAFEQMADDYVRQVYEHTPGKLPVPKVVAEVFGGKLRERFGGRESELLTHPRYRLHVFTSRGLHVLRHEGRLRTPLGYMGAVVANTFSRRSMGGWLERVVFSDPRETLPLILHGYRTHRAPLRPDNLVPSLLASCSVPFALPAVRDIPGAPAGAYWDGGITDYHLHLDYSARRDPPPRAELVLYPHFQNSVIPGWLDKALRHRHRATARLERVVLLSPTDEWVRSLPNGKLPDRGDFKTYVDDDAGRIAAWSRVVRESERLRDEFAQWLQRGSDEGVQVLA